jgi:hypothetical protein
MTDKIADAAKEQFDGFAILEEAALTMLGVPDEAGVIEIYREQLRRLLMESLGNAGLANAAADKLLDIIIQRRKEIEHSAGANLTERKQ